MDRCCRPRLAGGLSMEPVPDRKRMLALIMLKGRMVFEQRRGFFDEGCSTSLRLITE